MRFPHTISSIVQEVYESPLEDVEDNPDVPERIFKAEVLDWDVNLVPRLKNLSLETLALIFDRQQPMTGILQQDINHLMEILPTDIDLKYTVDIIFYEIYWQRCCTVRWPDITFTPTADEMFWKKTYVKRHLENYIETIVPEEFNEEEAVALATLINKYLDEINIQQLLMVKLPEIPVFSSDQIEDECIIPELDIPVDHVSLTSILSCLTNLTKFRIVFAVNNIAQNYDERLFCFSKADCEAICAGLKLLPNLKVFCINKSRLDDINVKIFLKFILKKDTIEELDLSHCHIGDKGACAIGQCLKLHKNLRIVRLRNNKFGDKGMQGIAYALQMEPRAILDVLDLKMNYLSMQAANYLSAAIIRARGKPKEIILSCCNLTGRAASMVAGMLLLNRGLERMDISANDFSGDAENYLRETIAANQYVLDIDMRGTGISDEVQEEIQGYLQRNRTLVGTEIIPLPDPPLLYLNDPEYLIWEYNPNNAKHEKGHYPPRVPEI